MESVLLPWHIKAVFEDAREQGAVLFLDETDSLLSKRVATGESCSTSINQERNTLMQELDRFDILSVRNFKPIFNLEGCVQAVAARIY